MITFGYPLRIRTDPDGSFQAAFEAAMDEAGVYIDYIPAGAHNKIGLIARTAQRNIPLTHGADHRTTSSRRQRTDGTHISGNTWSAGQPPYVAAWDAPHGKGWNC